MPDTPNVNAECLHYLEQNGTPQLEFSVYKGQMTLASPQNLHAKKLHQIAQEFIDPENGIATPMQVISPVLKALGYDDNPTRRPSMAKSNDIVTFAKSSAVPAGVGA